MSTLLWSAGRLDDWLKMNAPAGYVKNVARADIPGGAGLPQGIDSAIYLSLDGATPQNPYDVTNGGHRVQLQHGSGAPMGSPVNVDRCWAFWAIFDEWPASSSAWQIVAQVKQNGGGTPGIDLQYRGGMLMLTDRTDNPKAQTTVAKGTPVEVWLHHRIGSAGFADLYVNRQRIGGFTGSTNGDGVSNVAGYPCLDIYTSDALAQAAFRSWYCAGFQVWDGLPNAVTPAPPPAAGDTAKPTVSVAVPGTPQSGAVQVVASSTDNVKVTSLIAGINGTAIKQTITDPDPTQPITFDIASVAPGSYWVWVAARDAAGNEGTASAPLTVASAAPPPPPPPPPPGPDPCAVEKEEIARLRSVLAQTVSDLTGARETRDQALARATAAEQRIAAALPHVNAAEAALS